MRSGHIEVDSLYGGGGGAPMVVNSMNAPNNSTLQCGCENIDCPFCNQMMSIQGGAGGGGSISKSLIAETNFALHWH